MTSYESNGFSPDNKTRILYVDPNDIYGDIDGVPLTPDYTDYCIWCNLTVEKYSRIKNDVTGHGIGYDTEVYNITWDGLKKDFEGTDNQSFMMGADANYNYLTTDYTDIDFTTVKKKNMVEGLGIESINIAMNNYYIPEITINFIDVRGAGFFGREEATHNSFELTSLDKDEYGRTVDNFYNCFVSFPYPRFRLQVKGFYGKPVTYQLCCSHFSGEFDSNTGNFKLTAKFIGYQYSILADIPFMYILAAPYCRYGGVNYWETHVHSDAWKLSDNTEPIALYDFYQKIRKSINNDEDKKKLMGGSENIAIESGIQTLNYLNLLRVRFSTLVNSIRDAGNFDYVIDTFSVNEIHDDAYKYPEQQIIFLKKGTPNASLTQKVCNHYQEFVTSLNDFETKFSIVYTEDQKYKITKDLKPNRGEDKWNSGDIVLTKFITFKNEKPYTINVGKSYPLHNSKSSYGVNVAAISSGGSNGTISVSRRLSEKISKYASSIKGVDSDIIYACILDCKGFMQIYYEVANKLSDKIKETRNLLEKRQETNMVNYFGFAPYVGNFFKIVMCHLETFVHIIYEMADKIDQSLTDRTPAKLGIGYGDMDLQSSIVQVPAFPAIYKSKVEPNDKRYENLENAVDERGWPGDITGSVEWEEKKLIDELYNALFFVSSPRTDSGLDEAHYKATSIIENVCPVIPSDLLYRIPKYAYNSKDKLYAYLGMRLMQLFALFNRGNDVGSDIANKFGCLDAYNFYKNETSLSVLTNLIGTFENTSQFVDDAIKTITCYDDGGDRIREFEFLNTDGDRQPIFELSGSKLVYKYMLSRDGIPLIPYNVDSLTLNGISGRYIPPSGDRSGHTFLCTIDDTSDQNGVTIANNAQYTGNSSDFIDSVVNEVGDNSEIKEKYVNSSLFHVFYQQDDIEKIDKIFETINNTEQDDNEQFNVLKENSKNYTDIARKYWSNIDVDEDYFYNPRQLVNEKRGIEIENYLKYTGRDGDYENYKCSIATDPNYSFFNGEIPTYNNPEVSYLTANGIHTVTIQGKQYVEVLIKNRVYINKDCLNNQALSLFGSAFYYLQNGENSEWRFIPSPAPYFTNPIDDTVKRVKVLLMLHTYPFEYEALKYSSFFNNNNKKNGGIEKVPYIYLLFIGGLIWRKREIEKNGTDPIKYGTTYRKPSDMKDPLLYKKDGMYYFVCTTDPIDYNVRYSDIVNENMDLHCENYLYKMFVEYVDTFYDMMEKESELHAVENKTTDQGVKAVERHLYYNDIREIAQLSQDQFAAFLTNETYYISNDRQYKISDWQEKYLCLYRQGNGPGFYACRLYLEEYEEMVNSVRKRKCYVLTSGSPSSNFETVNSVTRNTAEHYMTGFATTIFKLAEVRKSKEVLKSVTVDERSIQERDFKVAIYMYLKNIWDKWLCGYYYSKSKIQTDGKEYMIKETFNVENYFINFMFVDSFYRNIFKRLKLNCEILIDKLDTATDNFNIYSYLGTIVSKHQCMFIALPDYVNLGDDDDTVAKENMKSMFTPLPANSTPLPQRDNRFIVMYTHQPSSIATVDKSDFKPDYFDIWSEHDGTNISPDVFKVVDNPNKIYTGLEQQINRYGYNVPAFGIAYSRQSNAIFKSIKASMDNPAMTEQAILAMGDIAEMGNSTKKKVCFYGQDIYPIYSNYSYTIEVEMMGDAQIQPLMYFQLMNIPMFRGTYMIIAVTHSISQGNMTTRIKATKMSKYATPFVSNWYTVSPNTDDKTVDGYNSTSILNGVSCTETGNKMAEKLLELSTHPWDYSKGEIDLTRSKSPEEQNRKMVEGELKNAGRCAGYVTRAIQRGGGLTKFKNADSARNGEYEDSLNNEGFKLVTDKITSSNISEVVNNAKLGDVAVFQPFGTKHTYGHVQMCVGIKSHADRYGYTTEWCSDFKQPAFWPNSDYRDSWSAGDSYVRIYRYQGVCDVVLDEVSYTEKKLSQSERDRNLIKLMRYFTEQLTSEGLGYTSNLSIHQAAAICGNIFKESQYSPYAVEDLGGGKKGNGRGLCQWSVSERRSLKDYDLGSKYGYNVENMMKGDNDTCLYSQARYCAWEMRTNKKSYGARLFGENSVFNKMVSDDTVMNTAILDAMTQDFCDIFLAPGKGKNRKKFARDAYTKYMTAMNK